MIVYLGHQKPFPSRTSRIIFLAIAVSGFSSNPGSCWLTSVKCDGITHSDASASQFTYLEGTAWWYWVFLFELPI